MKTRALAVLVVALVSPRAGWADKDDVYALVGGRVVTGAGSVLEAGTIVLRDGLIEAVGTQVAPPVDARVIDVKGLTLTPGLIDGFGGVGLPTPRRGERGGGTARPGGAPPSPPAAGELAPQALTLEKVRAPDALKARDAGITTVLAIPREGVAPGQSVLLNLSGETAEGMVIRQPAGLHVHMATLARRYPGSLMGTVAYVRQALLDAGHYRDAWAAWERAPRGQKRPRYDAALEAWRSVLSGAQPLVVTARFENDVRRALGFADEFKVRVIVAGAPFAHRLAGVLRARGTPLLVSVNFDPPRPVGGFGGADEDKERREIEEAERNPARLHEAGVAFALVSGHATDFLKGVRTAIARGLPREAALRALTLGAAEALGVADRLGTLEPGKIANVVAWSGEPLTKDAKAKLVFVDGTLHEPDQRRRPRSERDDDEPGDEEPTEGGSR